jgi:hypothetical protein
MVNILRGVHTAKMTVLPTKVQFVNYVIIIKTKVLSWYDQNRKIGNPNNFKVFGSNTTKKPKQDSENWPEGRGKRTLVLIIIT